MNIINYIISLTVFIFSNKFVHYDILLNYLQCFAVFHSARFEHVSNIQYYLCCRVLNPK